ncbi:hypothetical protein [Pseudomonas cavernae]|uniref:hypothetical protein n=1 Tax=Pseudomonas cavernae TaxID=2320867 RepID=UPI0013C3F47B|nr:hypothetical protein [Pseudomonas cavernae]
MSEKLPVDVLERLIELLKEEPTPPAERNFLTPQEQQFIKSSAIYLSDLEDYISSSERRGSYRLSFLIKELAAYNSIPLRYLYHKPRFAYSSSVGHPGIEAFDAAALLIHLEDLGIDLNPAPIIQRLAKKLKNKTTLTESELSVWNHEKLRHRSRITIKSDLDIMHGFWEEERFKSATGYRYKVIMVKEKAYRLEVTGPKHRNLKPRQNITCDYCGICYQKGDLESSLTHRSEHSRLKRILEPKPKRQFAERLLRHKEPELVNGNSPLWMHQAVRERAAQFRRMFHYDFLQWNGSSAQKATSNAHGYLFADHNGIFPPGTIVGACAFMQRKGKWSLAWIWVIPSMRRHGVLLSRWPTFLERYGDFDIEHPLSDAMEIFVRQHGTDQQRSHLSQPA